LRVRVIAAALAATVGIGISTVPSASASPMGSHAQKVFMPKEDLASKALAFMRDADHKASNKMCGWPG
jgi:hypothetical protein